MIRNTLLFCLVGLSLLWAESVEFNTNGTDYEMGATLHTRIDAATNGHIKATMNLTPARNFFSLTPWHLAKNPTTAGLSGLAAGF